MTAPLRSRSRRSRRGAAYTELLAIMPALIVINMALFHLWNAYAAKQWSMHTARHSAWTPAMKGCQAPVTVQGAEQATAAPDPALEQLSGQVQKAKQEATVPAIRKPFDQLSKQVNGAQAQGKGQRTGSDYAVLGGGTYGAGGVVVCNEVPASITDADEKKAVDDAWKKYIQ